MNEETDQKLAPAVHSELDIMRVVGEAIESLTDIDARNRVMAWIVSRFGVPPSRRIRLEAGNQIGMTGIATLADREFPGIARLTPSNELEVTIRDLKANSTVDAAVRLAHVVIYANEKLTGERAVSSRKVLSPILKEWKAYDGNTRAALARHKGIHRDDDLLSLDSIAKQDAEKYIIEILDESVQGSWNPRTRTNKKTSSKKNNTSEERAE
jgi:hypothetical protein